MGRRKKAVKRLITEAEKAIIQKAIQVGEIKQMQIASVTAEHLMEAGRASLGPAFQLTKVGVIIGDGVDQMQLVGALDVVVGMNAGTDAARSAFTWHMGELMRKLREFPHGDNIVEQMISAHGISKYRAMSAERIVKWFPVEDRDPRLTPSHYALAIRFRKLMPFEKIKEVLKRAAEGEEQFITEVEVGGDGTPRRVVSNRIPWSVKRFEAEMKELCSLILPCKPGIKPVSSDESPPPQDGQDGAGLTPRTGPHDPQESPRPGGGVDGGDDGVFHGFLYVSFDGRVVRSPYELPDTGDVWVAVIKSPEGVSVNGKARAEVVVPEVLPPEDEDSIADELEEEERKFFVPDGDESNPWSEDE